MAISYVTLTAGCFVNTNTRIMQVAGILTKQGFTPRYCFALGRQHEIEHTNNYTKDCKREKEYTFKKEPGIPVVLSISQDLSGTIPESVMIMGVDGEILSGNDEGLVPPLVNARDPKTTKRCNNFLGRPAFVDVSREETRRLVVQTPRVPECNTQQPTKEKKAHVGMSSILDDAQSIISGVKVVDVRKQCFSKAKHPKEKTHS